MVDSNKRESEKSEMVPKKEGSIREHSWTEEEARKERDISEKRA